MSEVNFVNTNADEIITELINDFEDATGDVLAIGDPRRQFLQGFAVPLMGILNVINTTGKGNLLRYARGNALDAMGEFFGTTRRPATKAITTLVFWLTEIRAEDVIIPAGTRVTTNGLLFFATVKDITIMSGYSFATVEAMATLEGQKYNGFLSQQITILVDGNPYIQSVYNSDTSSGGADIESDDEYRSRIRLAPFSLSTAGAKNTYEYWARSASADVGDVSIYSVDPCEVIIVVVKKNGIIPTSNDPIIQAVADACSADSVRPLTDLVSVIPATALNKTVNVEYYISPLDSQKATAIQAAVNAAVEEYKLWQMSSIGKAINPDYLRRLMFNAGAVTVNVIAPASASANVMQVAQFTATTVTYKGLST